MLLPKSHSSQLRAVFFVLEKHKIAQASPSRCLMPDFAMVVAKTSMTLQRQVLKRPTVVLATLQKKGAFTHQKLWYIVVLWVEEKMQGSNVFFIPGIAGVLEMFPSTHSIRGKLKTIRMRSLPHRFQVSNFSILGTVVYTISKNVKFQRNWRFTKHGGLWYTFFDGGLIPWGKFIEHIKLFHIPLHINRLVLTHPGLQLWLNTCRSPYI